MTLPEAKTMRPCEVAAELGYTTQWLARLEQRGELRAIQPGRGRPRRYLREDVEAFKRAHTTRGEGAAGMLAMAKAEG